MFPVTSEHQRNAYKVYCMAAELAAIGGTNYLSGLATTLVTAANIFQNLHNEQIAAAHLVIAYNNANSAGAGLTSLAMTTAAGLVKHLQACTPRQLEQAELLLRCKLGRAKAYPQ
jgi:hypothetical protein